MNKIKSTTLPEEVVLKLIEMQGCSEEEIRNFLINEANKMKEKTDV